MARLEFPKILIKWEYLRTLNLSEGNLDRLGDEGWELVAIDKNGVGIFKRPKLEEKRPNAND